MKLRRIGIKTRSSKVTRSQNSLFQARMSVLQIVRYISTFQQNPVDVSTVKHC